MRNAATAHRLLSLVSAPEKAASIVGDLEEEASTRGQRWFWRNVLHTAATHLGRDLSKAPLRMIAWAFWGWSGSWALAQLFSLAVAMWRSRLIGNIPSWELPVHAAIYLVIAPFLCGWDQARHKLGKAMAAACATVMLMAVVQLVSVYLSNLQVQRIGQPWPGMEWPFLQTLARTTFFLAGSILFRMRATAGSHAGR
ncbi:MAG: hypothetical protein QM757_44875 [Paludibaculum sp.]